MKAADTSFDGVSAAFYEYEQSVRGAVRYELTRENLSSHLEEPQHILDVGGGSGPDAAWAANNGHSVVLIEPSAEQLAIAKQHRFPQLDSDAQARITLRQGTLNTLSDDLYESFDMVFSHGVAMYLDEPEIYWRDCLQFVKPGGLLSILEKGFTGTAMRLARENRPVELAGLLQTKRTPRNNMDRSVRAFTVENLHKSLQWLGCEAVQTSGIRIVTDHMYQPRTELTDAQWATWLDEERRLAHDPNTMHAGQMLHVIARKK